MRAAAILGPNCSLKNLKPFQIDDTIDWSVGVPIASNQADVILLLGGDGTIHRHLSPLVQLALPVLIVPSGSGNDFARDLGLRRLRDSVNAWRRFCHEGDNVRSIDLGIVVPLESSAEKISDETSRDSSLASQRYFCSVAGVGLDSEVARQAGALPRWLRGHGGYALSLVPNIFRFAPFRMKISTRSASGDGEIQSDQSTILAAFGNSSTYGQGMKIAPKADLTDGQLDVCVIGGLDPFRLFCLFPTVYFGRHLRIREVKYFRTAGARVETEFPLDVYADGEYVCRTPVELSVQSAAIRMIVPPS
jgi:diacylglycerol kinase (ATP)